MDNPAYKCPRCGGLLKFDAFQYRAYGAFTCAASCACGFYSHSAGAGPEDDVRRVLIARLEGEKRPTVMIAEKMPELADIFPLTKRPDGAFTPTAVAVDFDGCLSTDAWPETGTPNTPLFEWLIAFRKAGGNVILWTCREEDTLAAAVAFCNDNGLEFDAVNENLPSWREVFGNDTRKVGADWYLDDKAIWQSVESDL